MISSGAPMPMTRPKSSTRSRSTTEFSACRTCSIQMIVMPCGVDGPDRGDQRLAFAFGQPARDFVQQQKLRPRRHRARQFQPLAVQKRERPGQLRWPGAASRCRRRIVGAVVRRPRPRACPGRRRRRPAGFRTPSACSKGCGIWKLRPDAHRARGPSAGMRVTSRPRKVIVPGIGQEVAGDQVEQRRFARAVRPDDAQRLPLRHGKADTSSVTLRAPKLFDTFGEGQDIGHAGLQADARPGDGARRAGQRVRPAASIVPPVGMSGAVLLSTMTRSKVAVRPCAATGRRPAASWRRSCAAKGGRPAPFQATLPTIVSRSVAAIAAATASRVGRRPTRGP